MLIMLACRQPKASLSCIMVAPIRRDAVNKIRVIRLILYLITTFWIPLHIRLIKSIEASQDSIFSKTGKCDICILSPGYD